MTGGAWHFPALKLPSRTLIYCVRHIIVLRLTEEEFYEL
jgi:hypothetical protein